MQTLRAVNSDLAQQGPITTAGGDTLKQLAIHYDTTVDWLWLYKPDYDRWPRSDPFPVGIRLGVGVGQDPCNADLVLSPCVALPLCWPLLQPSVLSSAVPLL
ncbi:hypothetical protein [Synechococcus sp. RedBA-s]|uniref:hypothetical protein n=1 Tax=Synechococcus sp. RedBA-s TaxID=2823741 RepID=UPI0020CC4560|nr:hypothetical protein [Synechococcus sp. RedBA-s]